MKRSITMDAADYLEEFRAGDFVHPPMWENARMYDEIVEVRRASRRGDAGARNEFIEIVGEKATWLVQPNDQVEVVRL